MYTQLLTSALLPILHAATPPPSSGDVLKSPSQPWTTYQSPSSCTCFSDGKSLFRKSGLIVDAVKNSGLIEGPAGYGELRNLYKNAVTCGFVEGCEDSVEFTANSSRFCSLHPPCNNLPCIFLMEPDTLDGVRSLQHLCNRLGEF